MPESNPKGGNGSFRFGAILVLAAAAILAVVLVVLHVTHLSSARSDLGTATAKGPVVQVVEAGAASAAANVTVQARSRPINRRPCTPRSAAICPRWRWTRAIL